MAAAALNISAAKVKKAATVEQMPTWTEWHDLQVNEVNRYLLHTNFFAYESEQSALAGDMTKSANYLSLEGAWKFNWVANADQRPTDFYKADYDDSAWKTMQVPVSGRSTAMATPNMSTPDLHGDTCSTTRTTSRVSRRSIR